MERDWNNHILLSVATGLFKVRVDGKVIGWYVTRAVAEAAYAKAVQERDIPMDGSYDPSTSVTGPQDCGLVAGVDY